MFLRGSDIIPCFDNYVPERIGFPEPGGTSKACVLITIISKYFHKVSIPFLPDTANGKY